MKFKKPSTDSIIDMSVDLFLILWDVLSSPILIVMRIMRHIFKKAFSGRLKRVIKWFVHKVLRIK
jgi:hypothetical protein